MPAELALAYLRHAFTQALAVVDELGEELLDERPVGDATSAVGALVVHCCAVTEYWLGHVALGRPSTRDRAAEFRARTSPAECRASVAATLAQAAADLDRLEQDGGVPSPLRAGLPGGDGCDAAVVLHVLEELFQHLGQMELTRDVLLARSRDL